MEVNIIVVYVSSPLRRYRQRRQFPPSSSSSSHFEGLLQSWSWRTLGKRHAAIPTLSSVRLIEELKHCHTCQRSFLTMTGWLTPRQLCLYLMPFDFFVDKVCFPSLPLSNSLVVQHLSEGKRRCKDLDEYRSQDNVLIEGQMLQEDRVERKEEAVPWMDKMTVR